MSAEEVKIDIETRQDIDWVMRHFYTRLLDDDRIAYLFTEVARIDLQEHLPHLVHFWESILFDHNDYAKNVMQVHADLHRRSPISPEHFEIWLACLHETIDSRFAGERAQKMKDRARGIAYVMKAKVLHL